MSQDDTCVESALTSYSVGANIEALNDANDLKQKEVLDSMIGIQIEAAAIPDKAKAIDHAITETARLYEDTFLLEVSAEGTVMEFMGAADRYIELVNS